MTAVIARLLAVALLNSAQAQNSNVQSATDLLLTAPSDVAAVKITEIKLDDPFKIQLNASTQGKQIPFEVSTWLNKIYTSDYAGAAHLWTAIEKQLPESLVQVGKAAQLYCLWKLNLPQTFFDQWASAISTAGFLESREELALEQIIGPRFDTWLLTNAIEASPEQRANLAKIKPSQTVLQPTLVAWIDLRQGEQGLAVLPALLPSNALKIPLAQTVVLALARKGDVAGAAKVLKQHLEPAIEFKHDSAGISAHYLQVARLLYQAGSMDGAEVFYQKIPKGAPEFLKAREELTWVWLRKGSQSQLRGALSTLSLALFEDEFSPEVYLVRAISNLKLCYYDQVEKDLQAFIRNNKKFANQIEKNSEANEPPPPSNPDYFSKQANIALTSRNTEMARLKELGVQSIGASLPAVGMQLHWEKAVEKMAAMIESAKKVRAQEYRRQWKNQHLVLSEAIRKMRFVKVEYLSQIKAVSITGAGKPGAKMPALTDADLGVQPATVQSFPFDGVIWSDELFHLRSVAQGRCLGGIKQ